MTGAITTKLCLLRTAVVFVTMCTEGLHEVELELPSLLKSMFGFFGSVEYIDRDMGVRLSLLYRFREL